MTALVRLPMTVTGIAPTPGKPLPTNPIAPAKFNTSVSSLAETSTLPPAVTWTLPSIDARVSVLTATTFTDPATPIPATANATPAVTA